MGCLMWGGRLHVPLPGAVCPLFSLFVTKPMSSDPSFPDKTNEEGCALGPWQLLQVQTPDWCRADSDLQMVCLTPGQQQPGMGHLPERGGWERASGMLLASAFGPSRTSLSVASHPSPVFSLFMSVGVKAAGKGASSDLPQKSDHTLSFPYSTSLPGTWRPAGDPSACFVVLPACLPASGARGETKSGSLTFTDNC